MAKLKLPLATLLATVLAVSCDNAKQQRETLLKKHRH
jgi:hypothetical protein